MNWKRALALLLAVMMVASIFAGCAAKESADTEPADSKTEDTEKKDESKKEDDKKEDEPTG